MTAALLVKVGMAVAAIVAGVLVHRATGDVYFPESGSMKGKTVLITGGTTGLGLESAKRLAKAGANIIITARTDTKGDTAVRAIRDYCSNYNEPDIPQISYKILNLDDLESTKEAANWELPTSIDVLMLNAGVMALPTQQLTSLGIEKQFHTNHLGHFVFTASIQPFLAKTARIVVVSSMAHKIPLFLSGLGRFPLDLEYSWKHPPEKYMPLKSYGMSKLANVYFAARLDEISGYTAVSLHPGAVATDLGRELTTIQSLQQLIDSTLYPIAKSIGAILSVEQGANTQVFLASCPNDQIVGGGYYAGMTHQPLWKPFVNDMKINQKAIKLWEQSEEMSGVKFTF